MDEIGDAALTTDFVWGEGCSSAFRSAEMLADAIGTYSESSTPADIDKSLRLYRQQHYRRPYIPLLQNITSSRRERLGWIQATVFKAAQVSDHVRRLLFDVQSARNDSIPHVLRLIGSSVLAVYSRSKKSPSKTIQDYPSFTPVFDGSAANITA
jgi:flavin-dependent dehydrogenase